MTERPAGLPDWARDNTKPHADRCDRDPSWLPDEVIVRSLRLINIKYGMGVLAAIAKLAGVEGATLRHIAQGKSSLGERSRGQLSYIIPLIHSGRMTFQRFESGMEDGKRNRSGLRAVMAAPKVEERLKLEYPVALMRTIARGTDDLSHLVLPNLRHRVYDIAGRTGLSQVQGAGLVGSDRRSRRDR